MDRKVAKWRCYRFLNQQVLLAGYLMEGPIRKSRNQYERALRADIIRFSSNAAHLMGI